MFYNVYKSLPKVKTVSGTTTSAGNISLELSDEYMVIGCLCSDKLALAWFDGTTWNAHILSPNKDHTAQINMSVQVNVIYV